MLPPENRLTDSLGFTAATRGGQRAGGRGLVLHLTRTGGAGAPQVGMIVSRAVGNSVVRNRVKRRLRHLVRARLGHLEPGTVVAVRALPASASMTSAELGGQLDRCL